MFNYRENAYIPPPPAPLPERIRAWVRERVQNLRKSLSFWWWLNEDSVKGFVLACVLLGFFLCCCYGITAGYITISAPLDSDDSFHHHHHDSHLHRSMFHSSSRRSRSNHHR
jgi:hypothetical protein